MGLVVRISSVHTHTQTRLFSNCQAGLLNAVLESARVGALEEYQDNTATIPPTSPTKRTPSSAPVNKAHADQSTNERRESTGLHDILESHHENSVGSPNNDCEGDPCVLVTCEHGVSGVIHDPRIRHGNEYDTRFKTQE